MSRMNKRSWGQLEEQFFRWFELSNKSVYRIGEIREVLEISSANERKLLERLNKRGLICRVSRGLYLLRPGRSAIPWRPSRGKVLETLLGKEYQLCGLEMFNYYGLSDQISNQTYAYTTKISGERIIDSRAYRFIKVPNWRLGQTQTIKENGAELIVPRYGRCVFDAIYDYGRFNTLPRAYEWIENQKANKAFLRELVESTIHSGNVASQRRIGFTLESIIGSRSRFVKELKTQVSETKAVIPLDPNRPTKGNVIRSWGIVDNGE